MNFFSQEQILNDSNLEIIVHSNNPLQWLWNLRIGREYYVANPAFPVFLTVSSYFLICTLLMIIDFSGNRLRFLYKYKIQVNVQVTWPMVFRALRMNLFNNVLLILPATIAQCIWVPPTPMPPEAPSVQEFLSQIFMMLIIFDFQYWIWHTTHHKIKWLYRNFHAIHHQFHSTFGWTTQYTHPWEVFTLGLFTTVDGWFFECHPLTFWGFMVANIYASVEDHCGFDFPISLSHIIPFGLYGGSAKHDMHHMRPLTNFQPHFRTWDRIMGWDCPGLQPGGIKSKELLEWEERNKSKRLNKHATQLMKGVENGLLFPEETVHSKTQLKYD